VTTITLRRPGPIRAWLAVCVRARDPLARPAELAMRRRFQAWDVDLPIAVDVAPPLRVEAAAWRRVRWDAGEARCPCGYECTTVAHASADAARLECPGCHAMTLAVHRWCR